MKKVLVKLLAILSVFSLFACGVNKVDGNGGNVASNVRETEAVDDSNYADKTIMFYIIGSDLEENVMMGTEIVASVSEIKHSDNLNIVIMTGGSLNENIENTRKEETSIAKYGEFYNINWEKNQIWKVDNGLKAVNEDFGSEDMTEEKTLEKYITYVKKEFPAKTYDIIFSDHGGGGLFGFGSDTRYPSNNGKITLSDIDKAFKNTNIKFSTVGFDACLMASFELVYTLEPYADYLIASEETAFGGWNYKFLNSIANDTHMDPLVYSKKIVDDFIDNSEINANSLGVYKLNGFRSAVGESVSKFCKNMNKYLSEDNYLIELYGILKKTMGLGYNIIGDVRDLRDFLDWIENMEDSNMPVELKSSAHEFWEKVEPFVLYYRTKKPKNEDNSERTGGINFVFPIDNVYYFEDDVDNAILSMENYPDSINEDFRLMFKMAFLRKSLVRELKDNAFEADDIVVTSKLLELCDRAYDKYKIPKEYIDKIKDNIAPMLASNRLKANDGGNINFIKKTDGGKVSFDFVYDDEIAWMIYKPLATARMYAGETEHKLGSVNVAPSEKYTEGDKTVWKIIPEEDKWFKAESDGKEFLVDFEVVNSEEDDAGNMNYLFDKPIEGFVPAVLRRYENDSDDDNVIQIQVSFNKNDEYGTILGFTRYDQVSNLSAKDMEDFRQGDRIKLITNFDDFYTSKRITYSVFNEIPIETLYISRGYIKDQSVYFKYSIMDIYNETYDFEVTNQFAFALGDSNGTCMYSTFPSTWTSVVINEQKSSFESVSSLGQHSEIIDVNLYDITNNAKISIDPEGFTDSAKEIFLSDDDFLNITDLDSEFIEGRFPVFNVMGNDNNKNNMCKKYVYFETDDNKYMIEFTCTIIGGQGENATFHNSRLNKTAQELIHGANTASDDVPTLMVTPK